MDHTLTERDVIKDPFQESGRYRVDYNRDKTTNTATIKVHIEGMWSTQVPNYNTLQLIQTTYSNSIQCPALHQGHFMFEEVYVSKPFRQEALLFLSSEFLVTSGLYPKIMIVA